MLCLLLWSIPVIKAQVPTPCRSVDPLLLAIRSHRVNPLDILSGQGNHLEVVDNALLRNRLGQNNAASVDLIRDKESRNRDVVLVSDLFQLGVGQQRSAWGQCIPAVTTYRLNQVDSTLPAGSLLFRTTLSRRAVG